MADQKDRLGDKLKDKERAEEDRYFAEQDKEKLRRLKSEGAPPAPTGLCPKDSGAPLVHKTIEGITVDLCETCGGVWLDKGELEAITERSSEGWMSKWIRGVLKEMP
jgi:hypothetical protein